MSSSYISHKRDSLLETILFGRDVKLSQIFHWLQWKKGLLSEFFIPAYTIHMNANNYINMLCYIHIGQLTKNVVSFFPIANSNLF